MTVRNTLTQIESRANWLRYYSEELARCVERLSAKRSFETSAEADIDEAERALLDTLAKVQAAKQAFAAKPVNDRAA